MKLSLITATHFRPQLLANCAVPSVMNQSDCEFEWIIINDGKDPQTRDLIQSLKTDCSMLVYLEMEHPREGFGLCHARNLGLSVATGELIAYLDDDNAIAPTFVAKTKAFFEAHPLIRCAMVQQRRKRIVVRNEQPIKESRPFIAPDQWSRDVNLIQMQDLFDSNGYTHRRENAPQWSPEYKVFADYEYFLQCLEAWGRNSFCVHPEILVDYVQRSDGVIGRSTYGEWATELAAVVRQHQQALSETDLEALDTLIQKWQNKHIHNQKIPAFSEART